LAETQKDAPAPEETAEKNEKGAFGLSVFGERKVSRRLSSEDIGSSWLPKLASNSWQVKD